MLQMNDTILKTYFDYHAEISATELYDGLVGCGLFAEKIPRFLTSQAFLKYTNSLDFPYSQKAKDYIRYSHIRNISIPRSLAIPEPFAYATQCKHISNCWDKILQHFECKTANDSFKKSRIHLRKIGKGPKLYEMNYKNFFNDGDPTQDIIIKSKYIAYADISNCFLSIYSHSIPWALVGKKTAKDAKKRKDKDTWFNLIDLYTRNIKHGETNGILIGPHSSNLLAELVLTSIDYELSKHGFQYIRNIDDYSCYVPSLDDAERFYLKLSEELRKYDLTLNTQKTKTCPLPQANTSFWVTKLNHFNFTHAYIDNGKETLKVKGLKGFLDFAVELMLAQGTDAAILNYAIKMIGGKGLSKQAIQYYTKHINHLILLFPYLVSLLEDSVFNTFNIEKQIIKQIAVDLYEYGRERNIYEACSFSLYWALKYKFDMPNLSVKQESLKSLDCIYMLLAYLYDSRHKPKKYLSEYRSTAKELNKSDFERYWLFIYETLPSKDLAEPYKNMKASKLTFVKPEFT